MVSACMPASYCSLEEGSAFRGVFSSAPKHSAERGQSRPTLLGDGRAAVRCPRRGRSISHNGIDFVHIHICHPPTMKLVLAFPVFRISLRYVTSHFGLLRHRTIIL